MLINYAVSTDTILSYLYSCYYSRGFINVRASYMVTRCAHTGSGFCVLGDAQLAGTEHPCRSWCHRVNCKLCASVSVSFFFRTRPPSLSDAYRKRRHETSSRGACDLSLHTHYRWVIQYMGHRPRILADQLNCPRQGGQYRQQQNGDLSCLIQCTIPK